MSSVSLRLLFLTCLVFDAPTQPALSWSPHHDGLLGDGPGYQATVDRSGLRFVTHGGSGGETAQASLGWRLQAIGRRGDFAALTRPLPMGSARGGVTATASGDLARVHRDAVTERYEMRPAGVNVSYVIEALPVGRGDLIVRIAIDSPLPPATTGEDVPELMYGDAVGGVHVGAVTGIDAAGRRASGWLHARTGALDLVLPAAFVAKATLPLLVDPLLSKAFPTMPYYGYKSVIAHGAVQNEFLVAYEEYLFAYSHDVYAQRLSSSGAQVGAPILIARGPHRYEAYIDAIAYVRGRDSFVVAYNPSGSRGELCVIDAATGQITSRFSPPAGTPAVVMAGESSVGGDRVFMVDGVGMVTALAVDADGRLRQVVAAPLGGRDMKLAPSGGADGRFFGVWQEAGAVEGVVFDRDLRVLDRRTVVAGSSSWGRALDGNGRQWFLVEANAPPAPLVALPVFWDSGAGEAYVGTPRALPNLRPATAFLGESVLLADTVSVLTVDPFSAAQCEGPQMTAPGAISHLVGPAGGDSAAGDLALVASFGVGQMFRAEDGLIENLGGGCLDRGWPAATCAVVGNADFHLRLRDAPAATAVALVLGATKAPAACGACTLWPELATGILVPVGPTDARGNAALSAPLPGLPSLLGASFVAQWLVAAGTACPLGLGLSDALNVEIQ
ncbi:MAG: hypothetical protein AAF628_27170 [Planctomycetota bacterium]